MHLQASAETASYSAEPLVCASRRARQRAGEEQGHHRIRSTPRRQRKGGLGATVKSGQCADGVFLDYWVVGAMTNFGEGFEICLPGLYDDIPLRVLILA